MSTKDAWSVAILILLVGCIPAATVQGAIVANKPTYSAGDYWEIQATGPSSSTTENITVASGTTVFASQTCMEQMIQETINGTTMIVNTYYRPSDLAEVGTYMELSASGISMKITVVLEPPVAQFHYPMKVGDHWKFQTIFRTTTESSFMGYNNKAYNNQTIDIDYTVVSEETVTVPAGTFDTLKITNINGRSSETQTFWYAPKAGNYVKMTSSNTSVTYELKSYSFKYVPSGGGGTTTTSNGMMVYLVIIVIVVVIIIVVVLVVMRAKKATPVPPAMAAPVAPPQTPQAPPPQYPPPQ